MTVAALRTVLAAPAHKALTKLLRDSAWWFDDDADVETTGVAFVRGDNVSGICRVGGEAGIVVVEGDVIADNVIVGGGASDSTVLFLGGVDARNLFLAPDTNAYCVGPCEIHELMFVASADASFTTLGPARIGLLYSGHGAAWLTARGPIAVDVLDDHVEGTRPTVARKRVTCASLVRPGLVHSTKPDRLDRDAVASAMHSDLALLVPPTRASLPPASAPPAPKVAKATIATATAKAKAKDAKAKAKAAKAKVKTPASRTKKAATPKRRRR